MKIRTHLLIWPICIVLGMVVSGRAEKESKGKRPGPVSLKDREAWESLSEEDREKLKQALRIVWSDPAVISARGDIQRAADDYKAAIKAAVSRSDPKIAALLERVQSANEGHFKERLGGRGPGPGPGGGGMPGGRPEWQGFLSSTGFMTHLNEEEKVKFRKVEAAAKETDAVKAAFSELKQMRERDDDFQKKRIETLRHARRTIQEEMVKIDPDMEKLLARGGSGTGKSRKRKEFGDRGEKRRANSNSGESETKKDPAPDQPE